MDVTSLAALERYQFADLLHGLTKEQWEAPSLCGGWRVREVVAHVITYLDRSPAAFTIALLRHRLHLNRLNAADVHRCSALQPSELIDNVREHATPRGVGAGFGGRIALVECMIHQQDIRRPLDLPRAIPAERIRTALDFAKIAPLIRGGWYTRGFRLIATDVNWSTGYGPEVRGPGEALLMTMARRPNALSELSGPGVAVLNRRLRP